MGGKGEVPNRIEEHVINNGGTVIFVIKGQRILVSAAQTD
jgi:hypothetical protein